MSERAFWVGVALYTALFVGAAAALGGAVPETETGIAWKANSAGTLIFGNRQAEIRDRYDTGALTLRSPSAFLTLPSDRQSARSLISTAAFDTRGAKLPQIPSIVVATASALPISSAFGASAAAAAPITADQTFFATEITPVPEPATWIVAVLLAGSLAWTRRSFARAL